MGLPVNGAIEGHRIDFGIYHNQRVPKIKQLMQSGMLCQNASAGKRNTHFINGSGHTMDEALWIVFVGFKGLNPGFQGGMQIPAG
jgi:hypothetical protein